MLICPHAPTRKNQKITKRTQLSHVDSASYLGRALQFAGLPMRAKYEVGRRSRVAERKGARERSEHHEH